MIINSQSQRDVKIEGNQETVKMAVSKNTGVEAHIVKILTENYKDPIGSHIRESISNHWDSHVEAGKENNPILVKLFKNNIGNIVFESSDEGLGMSEEEFYKYYMNIGESSKQNKPNLIGGFG